MAAIARSGKADVLRNREIAARLRYLRDSKFETQGFKSNEKTPSVEEARKMAGFNLRLMHGQTPTPRVSA